MRVTGIGRYIQTHTHTQPMGASPSSATALGINGDAFATALMDVAVTLHSIRADGEPVSLADILHRVTHDVFVPRLRGHLAELLGALGPEERVPVPVPVRSSLVAALYAKRDAPEVTDTEQCVICLTDLDDGVPTLRVPACRHVYHETCLRTWMERANTCPTCRGTIDECQ